MGRIAAAAVALLFHLPGLRIFLGRSPSRGILLANAVAILATVAGIGLAATTAGPWGAVAAWAAGHLLWGLYLALRFA